MSGRLWKISLVTTLIALLAIIVFDKLTWKTQSPEWVASVTTAAANVATLAIVFALTFFSGRAGVRAAASGRASVVNLVFLLFLGLLCSELAKLFPVAGLGAVLAIYGFAGLAVIVWRKLRRNPGNSQNTDRREGT
jgi:hypothetical protein